MIEQETKIGSMGGKRIPNPRISKISNPWDAREPMQEKSYDMAGAVWRR
jgi:hypothetical protein